MATELDIVVNKVDADVNYETTPADYVVMDLVNDYLIWTEGGVGVADGEDEPSEGELNDAATIIDPDDPVTVNKCLVFDKSEGTGTLRDVKGMGLNKRYVFGFSFDGATASEPQLEAWDDSDHDSTNKHVLGNGTPSNSFVKAVCTTNSLPGAGWAGTAIAGSGFSNVLKLNDGNGALSELESGESSQELYANIKIVVPAAYATPTVENFVLTVRYTYA